MINAIEGMMHLAYSKDLIAVLYKPEKELSNSNTKTNLFCLISVMAALIKHSNGSRRVVYAIVAIFMALTVMTIMPSAYAGTNFFYVNLVHGSSLFRIPYRPI
jgi:uncharacterized membrane protein YwaF